MQNSGYVSIVIRLLCRENVCLHIIKNAKKKINYQKIHWVVV